MENSEPSALRDHAVAPHLALILVQAMFGTWFIVGKVVLRTISSTGLSAFRVGGAALVLSLFQRNLKELWTLPRRDLAWLVLCSILGVALNQLLFVKGLSLTTAINAVLITATIPAFTLVISILLGYDRISWRRSLGIILAASGVVYLVDPLRADFSARTTLGNLLIVTNALSYSCYMVLSKDLFKRYGALNVITWVFLISSIMVVPLGAFGLSGDHLSTVSTVVWLRIAYIIAVPTAGAYLLNAWALARVSPSTVASYIYLQPLIAFGLAPLFLGERLNGRTVIACLLIFAGVGIIIRRGRRRTASEVVERPQALAP
jgi:drug/metabolite transporter (DMT)-like permease